MKELKIILFGALLVSLCLCQLVAGLGRVRDRHNLFDPIYSLDDVDIQSAATLTKSNSNQNNERPVAIRNSPTTLRNQRQTTSTTVAALDNGDSIAKLREVVRKQQELTAQKSTSTYAGSTSSFASTPAQVNPEPTLALVSGSASASTHKQEEPHHWSALENYYQRLRNTYQQPQPVYQVVQQEVDDSLHGYRPLQPTYVAPYGSPIANSDSSKPAFLLPIVNNQSPASADPDFGFPSYRQYAPDISRKGGIDAASIVSAGNYNIPQLVEPGKTISVVNGETSKQPLATVDDGKVKYLEWRKLPELLHIQQQQRRAQHQQETFGSLYDWQRSQELLQEEAYCGPRNYINFHVVSGPTSGNQRQAIKGTTLNYSPTQLSRLQQQLNGNPNLQTLDVPVALSAGEYPSHMGLYNGSSPSDDNYLCAATWIHERFALTLASCVLSAKPNQLTLQAGEWRLNQNSTNLNSQDKIQITRHVDEIHIFPKYNNNLTDHNLALLRFDKPIEYIISNPYISPACQVQSRNSIRTSSCWAPVRNITISEYFDADGEGETKEKKTVHMIEQPVRLIANDDAECFKQTKIEFFNFQHPNYICSADFRTTLWRVKLNHTNNFGSGIYCNEGGNLSLVSIIHPVSLNSSSAYGYLDLSYYKPWMRNVISGRAF